MNGEFHAPSENEKTENWGLRCRRLLSPSRAHLALCKKITKKLPSPAPATLVSLAAVFWMSRNAPPLYYCNAGEEVTKHLRCLTSYIPWTRRCFVFLFFIVRSSFLCPASRGFSLLFSRMAFSVYEVVRVACQSRSSFKRENDFVNTKSHVREELLLAGYPSSFSGSSFSTLPTFT